MEPQNQDNKPNEPQVIRPQSMFNPTVTPGQPAPPPPPQQPINSPPPFSSDDDARKKRLLTVIGAGAAAFVLLIIIVVVMTSGGNKSANNNVAQETQTGILIEPTALDIENANNSINSDITSLNDDNDFPQADLSDTNLQL